MPAQQRPAAIRDRISRTGTPAIAGLSAGQGPRHYAFGDSDLAARRLALLHEVYAPSSSALLADAVTTSPALAYDLGCGPGHTTGMVAHVTGAKRTVGLDSSASFVAAARARHEEARHQEAPTGGHLEFTAHDVLAVPFPAGPAELIYCRLLLAHLADPADVVRRWASQLTDHGLVVVDEIEWIETSHPLLRAHLRLAELMVAASGARMCAGPLLATLSDARGLHNRGLRTRLTRITEVPVPTATAAQLFAMNLAVAGDRPVTLGLCSAPDLASLRSGLAELTASTATGEITWGMRQAAYSR